MDNRPKMESYMKNYIKLGLVAFILSPTALVWSMEGRVEEHRTPVLIPHEKDNQRFFLEESSHQLQERRLATQEKKGAWKSFTDKVSKTFDKNHRNLSNDFSSTEVPHLTENQQNVFKKLSTQDQLEYINKWSSNKWETFEKERVRINTKHQNVMKSFDRQIEDLNSELKELKNPSLFTKVFGKKLTPQEVAVKELDIKQKIKALHDKKDNEQTTFNAFKKDFLAKNQNEFYKFANKFDELLNLNQGAKDTGTLQFNMNQGKFEIHQKNFVSKRISAAADASRTKWENDVAQRYKADFGTFDTKVKKSKSLDEFWQAVGTSDFTGTPKDKLDEDARAKALDALTDKFTELIDAEKQKMEQKLLTGQFLHPQEEAARKKIIDDMQTELTRIMQEFKTKSITPTEAEEQTKEILADVQKDDEMPSLDDMAENFAKKGDLARAQQRQQNLDKEIGLHQKLQLKKLDAADTLSAYKKAFPGENATALESALRDARTIQPENDNLEELEAVYSKLDTLNTEFLSKLPAATRQTLERPEQPEIIPMTFVTGNHDQAPERKDDDRDRRDESAAANNDDRQPAASTSIPAPRKTEADELREKLQAKINNLEKTPDLMHDDKQKLNKFKNSIQRAESLRELEDQEDALNFFAQTI